MNIKILVLALSFLTFLPAAGQAQNVLLPTEDTPSNVSTVKPAASLPVTNPTAAASTTATSTQTPTAASTATSFGNTINTGNNGFMSPADQGRFIQLEQQKIANIQQAIADLRQRAAQIAAAAKTDRDRAAALSVQNSYQQNLPDLNAQIVKAQQHLAVLQSGPVRTSDFARLYLGN